MKWYVRWAVLLLPLAPALHFIAQNLTLASPTQIGVVLLLPVAVSTFLFGLLRMLRRSPGPAAVFSAVCAFLLFTNIHFREVIVAAGVPPHESFRLAYQLPWHVLIALLSVVVYAWVHRKEERAHAVAVFSVVMLVFPVTQLAYAGLRTDDSPGYPQRVDAATEQKQVLPHVFVVVLDEYARADILRERFGFDNSAFLAALRQRGFTVAARSRSNYTQTQLSMLSLFSMQHLEGTADGHADAVAMLHEKLARAPVWEIFSRMGYRTVVSDSYPFMIKRDADVVLAGTVSERLFVDLFLQGSSWFMMGKLLRWLGLPADAMSKEDWMRQLQQNLDYVEEFAVSEQPVFMFSHIICPHVPLVLGLPDTVDAEQLYRSDDAIPQGTYRELYPLQVQALNTRVLNMIDGVLSTTRPVIILLLSDHGSRLQYAPHTITGTDYDERTAILFAAYTGEDAASVLPDDITLVNVFPLILNTFFDGEWPLQPNTLHYSTHDNPLDLLDVTREVNRTSKLTGKSQSQPATIAAP
jgi:hypothetical protein